MQNQSVTETAQTVVSALASADFRVSDLQLARWQRAGLLPKPQQRSLGRGRGSETCYPMGTTAQALVICRLQQQTRLLKRIGWELWWQGYEVDSKYWRPIMQSAAQTWDQRFDLRQHLFEKIDVRGADGSTEKVRAIEVFCASRKMPSLMRRVRKRVGSESFAHAIALLLDIATGDFAAQYAASRTDTSVNPDVGLLARALGMQRATKDKMYAVAPWPASTIFQTLAELSALLQRSFAEQLARNSQEDLRTARNELRSVFDVLLTIADFIEPIFGKYAFGVGAARELISSKDGYHPALLLLGWTVVREVPQFSKGIATVVSLASRANEVVQKFRLLESLRANNPHLRMHLNPTKIAAAMRDLGKMEELSHALARITELASAKIQ